jgi:hypothetical protein
MLSKLTSIVAILFLASQVICSAVPNPEADASPIAPAAPESQLETRISKKVAPDNLFKRDRTCAIVNNGDSSVTEVNCRSGPGTNYPVLVTLAVGSSWPFKCRKVGQCFDNGFGGEDW